jgi:hypothetical protein
MKNFAEERLAFINCGYPELAYAPDNYRLKHLKPEVEDQARKRLVRIGKNITEGPVIHDI